MMWPSTAQEAEGHDPDHSGTGMKKKDGRQNPALQKLAQARDEEAGQPRQ